MGLPQVPPVRQLLAIAALFGAAVVIAALCIAVGHSVALQVSGRLGEAELAIQRGQWILVAGSVAAFLIFLVLLPVRTRGDWRSHGVYAAFVVSLFAEMFGFPLTVYFISSAFGLTFFERQFMLYMHRVGMPVGSLVTFLGVLLIVLGWSAVYRARGRLATQGIYRYLRHPQYLGILFVTGGWLMHWPTVIGLVMWPILVVVYVRLAKKEEAYLASRFGSEFREYADKTGSFFPLVSGMPRTLPGRAHTKVRTDGDFAQSPDAGEAETPDTRI